MHTTTADYCLHVWMLLTVVGTVIIRVQVLIALQQVCNDVCTAAVGRNVQPCGPTGCAAGLVCTCKAVIGERG